MYEGAVRREDQSTNAIRTMGNLLRDSWLREVTTLAEAQEVYLRKWYYLARVCQRREAGGWAPDRG